MKSLRIFKISSSFGQLIVNAKTGAVIKCNSNRREKDYLPDIEVFDVNRYMIANKCKVIPHDVDILRFAYWSKNNVYEPPADGYEPISSTL